MKKILLLCPLVMVILSLSSCASKSPTRFERRFFDVQTNYVPVAVLTTNLAGVPTVVTQQVPNYVITPNAYANDLTQVVGTVGNLFGVGGIATTALAGIFGLWATLRSRKASTTSAALAQGVQTAREILKTTPQGQQIDTRLTQWLTTQQAALGVLPDVRVILTKVNTAEAQTIAKNLIGQNPGA